MLFKRQPLHPFFLTFLGVGLLVLLALIANTGYSAPAYVERVTLQQRTGGTVPGLQPSGPARAPVVVIDAGHGGADPGAVAANGVAEKDVVLDLARALRDALLIQGDVRVAMTREDDRFISLQDRIAIARTAGADLFISVHADSGGLEQNAAGASIYTLSNQASGRQAERFAARENDADVVNGIPLNTGNSAADMLLFEMAQRRALGGAAEFARLVVREGAGKLRFRNPPRRSAALVVLTAPDVPSVLLEAGFITNVQEAQRLTSKAGREQFASVTAAAVRSFFAGLPKRSASAALAAEGEGGFVMARDR